MGDADPPKIKKTLTYDVLWMDGTFTSKAVTETLLSPEREAGRLSAHDYDASVKFFSGFHRHYPVIGTLAAIACVPAFNNPKWSRGKQLALLFGLGVAGHGAGKVSNVVSHLKYIVSLDQPQGLEKAIKNVQAQVGGPSGRRFVIQWRYEVSPDDLDPEEQSDTSNDLILDINSESKQPVAPASRPKSKWEEIRSANSGNGRNSTWDTIRQHHERKAAKASASPPEEDETLWVDNPTGQNDRYATPDTYDKGDKYTDRTETRLTS